MVAWKTLVGAAINSINCCYVILSILLRLKWSMNFLLLLCRNGLKNLKIKKIHKMHQSKKSSVICSPWMIWAAHITHYLLINSLSVKPYLVNHFKIESFDFANIMKIQRLFNFLIYGMMFFLAYSNLLLNYTDSSSKQGSLTAGNEYIRISEKVTPKKVTLSIGSNT